MAVGVASAASCRRGDPGAALIGECSFFAQVPQLTSAFSLAPTSCRPRWPSRVLSIGSDWVSHVDRLQAAVRKQRVSAMGSCQPSAQDVSCRQWRGS
jgi:hypothetical protein